MSHCSKAWYKCKGVGHSALQSPGLTQWLLYAMCKQGGVTLGSKGTDCEGGVPVPFHNKHRLLSRLLLPVCLGLQEMG